MRKTIFSLLAFLFITSLCFAQQAQTTVSNTAAAPIASKIITAKVDAVTSGNPLKGTPAELVVVTDDGKKLSFTVKSGTPITDKDAKIITLSDVKKESKVTVEYTIKASGTNKALSIKLVE